MRSLLTQVILWFLTSQGRLEQRIVISFLLRCSLLMITSLSWLGTSFRNVYLWSAGDETEKRYPNLLCDQQSLWRLYSNGFMSYVSHAPAHSTDQYALSPLHVHPPTSKMFLRGYRRNTLSPAVPPVLPRLLQLPPSFPCSVLVALLEDF